jgi:hypothetical protein
VLTYGSCKLEAADAEADMDLICVAPNVSLILLWCICVFTKINLNFFQKLPVLLLSHGPMFCHRLIFIQILVLSPNSVGICTGKV